MAVQTLLEYGRITSVKGIPRLLRTKSPHMRLLWGCSIVCFLVLAACQAVMLTMSYLRYASVISIQEMPLDMSGTSKTSVQLPDITFCNINPFASNFTDATDVISIEQFLVQVKELTNCYDCSPEDELSMTQLREELMTTRGYMVQIGANNTQRISHKPQSLIASCHVWIVSGMQPSTLPCDKVVNIELYQDSMLYNCYTFKPPINMPSDKSYIGLILVFHLDNYGMDQYPYPLAVHPKLRYINGLIFNFHSPGSPPVFIQDQKFLQSGLFLDFKIRIQRHTRLVKPYGNCVEDAGKTNVFTNHSTYSQVVCWSMCKQKMLYDLCGCIDYNKPVDIKTMNHQRACLAMEYGKSQVLQDWSCLRKARAVNTQECLDKCPLPCEEIKFDTKMTHTSWPSGQLKAFYQDYISNRSYASHYKSLLKPHIDTTDNLAMRNLISRNFVGMQMYIDQMTMMEYGDRPQLPFIGFISQLGGALNLWAGITMVVVIELIEITYELIAKKCFKNKEEDSKSVDSEAGEQLEVLVQTKNSNTGDDWV